jgi:Electron transfer DM13
VQSDGVPMRIVARRRLLLAVIGAAALGGLALGLVLSRGSEKALAQGRPGVVAQGTFRSVSWGTDGTATIVRSTSGHLELRLSKSFSTQRAPELFVYLARHQGVRRTEWKALAPLHSAYGAQRYSLPPEAADTRGLSVAIVCTKCNKTWGAARFVAADRSPA